jgi:hypothetical protein
MPSSFSDNDSLSQRLRLALDGSLLAPLIRIVTAYASAADWAHATVETLRLAGDGALEPHALLLDTTRRRVLWTEFDTARVRAVSFDDLKAALPSAMGHLKVSVEGRYRHLCPLRLRCADHDGGRASVPQHSRPRAGAIARIAVVPRH